MPPLREELASHPRRPRISSAMARWIANSSAGGRPGMFKSAHQGNFLGASRNARLGARRIRNSLARTARLRQLSNKILKIGGRFAVNRHALSRARMYKLKMRGMKSNAGN